MNQQWIDQLPLDNIRDVAPVSGGDVNEAFKVTTKIVRISYLYNAIAINHFMQLK